MERSSPQRKPARPSPTRALSPRELASPRTAALPHAVCGSKGVQVWAAQIVKPGTVANKSFFVDWSILPESRYKLTFSFASSNLANSTSYEAMLFINEIGCSNNIVCMGPYGSTANNAGFIGIIRDNTNMGYLSTNLTDNPPSYLRGRPNANQIIVKIHRNNAIIETDYSPLPDKYTLILSLEQLED